MIRVLNVVVIISFFFYCYALNIVYFIIRDFYNFPIHHKWGNILFMIGVLNFFNYVISDYTMLVVAYDINRFFIRKTE